MMPQTSKAYKRLINEITTVDNKKFDDILIPQNALYNSKKTVKLLSDHFLIIVELKY